MTKIEQNKIILEKRFAQEGITICHGFFKTKQEGFFLTPPITSNTFLLKALKLFGVECSSFPPLCR